MDLFKTVSPVRGATRESKSVSRFHDREEFSRITVRARDRCLPLARRPSPCGLSALRLKCEVHLKLTREPSSSTAAFVCRLVMLVQIKE